MAVTVYRLIVRVICLDLKLKVIHVLKKTKKDKRYLSSKIKTFSTLGHDLRLHCWCYPQTQVEIFMLKVLLSDQPLLFQRVVAIVTTTFSNSRGGRLRTLRRQKPAS